MAKRNNLLTALLLILLLPLLAACGGDVAATATPSSPKVMPTGTPFTQSGVNGGQADKAQPVVQKAQFIFFDAPG